MNEYGVEENENDGIKKLRNAAKEVKVMRTENEELKARLRALETKSEVRDLRRVFHSKGVNPELVKFYQGDGTDESIDKWIDDNDELLSLRKPVSEESEPSTVQASEQEAYQLLREMASSRKLHLDLESRMKEATSKDEIMAIVNEAAALGVQDTY